MLGPFTLGVFPPTFVVPANLLAGDKVDGDQSCDIRLYDGVESAKSAEDAENFCIQC
ncbi:MAG: hypothetical protein F6J93_26460 [Oscillatoria sp. SIO1A7]|nr:hypothetical protein [Oscillatoria sp. SIO1A7]